MLGITLSTDLRMTKHTEKVLTSSSKVSLYALRVLRDHGMSTFALHDVAMATTVAHLMYASPAGGVMPVRLIGINYRVC